jgi:hypothetical protein
MKPFCWGSRLKRECQKEPGGSAQIFKKEAIGGFLESAAKTNPCAKAIIITFGVQVLTRQK